MIQIFNFRFSLFCKKDVFIVLKKIIFKFWIKVRVLHAVLGLQEFIVHFFKIFIFIFKIYFLLISFLKKISFQYKF